MLEGKAIIFSAPSGSGKTTLVKHLLQSNQNLEFSVSACTRPQRDGVEVHGKDYYFLSVEDFKSKIRNDEFVEWEEVYPDSFYGTLKEEVQRIWDKGHAVIFDVDVKGGVNLKNYFKEKALAVFVKVPSSDVLKERLRARGSETPESLQTRIEKFEYELGFEKQFDVTIINDNLEESCLNAESIVAEFLRN